MTGKGEIKGNRLGQTLQFRVRMFSERGKAEGGGPENFDEGECWGGVDRHISKAAAHCGRAISWARSMGAKNGYLDPQD